MWLEYKLALGGEWLAGVQTLVSSVRTAKSLLPFPYCQPCQPAQWTSTSSPVSFLPSLHNYYCTWARHANLSIPLSDSDIKGFS
ncbi:hypothetical protein LEMLEM_LOCUS22384 [Lemmus lemmus]